MNLPPASDGGYQAQEQQRSTDDYLADAIRNLNETEELGEDTLADLGRQREMLDNIQNNVTRMDGALDHADRKITEMENPWAIGPVRTKSSGNRYAVTGQVGNVDYAGEGGKRRDFNMEGYVFKRARIMRNWNKRYFRIQGDCIEYFLNQNDSKLRGRFNLKGATFAKVAFGQADHNGAKCNKDNCFEIVQAGQAKGDTIHVESVRDFNTWVSQIERAVYPERFKTKTSAAYEDEEFEASSESRSNRGGVQFGTEAQDRMVDTIMDKLDNIDGMSRMIGAEVEDQTKVIQSLSSDMDRLDGRVVHNKHRVQNIK